MATPTLASDAPPRRWRRVLWRVLLALVLLIVALGAGGTIWFMQMARSALPQEDGTIHVSGLKAPVTVVRDAQGVPHVTAASDDDLFFAQGYVQAQDRLWQMDVSRRWAAGEVSEILGSATLAHDREQRILGLRQVAERSLSMFPVEERARWDAYARGVNAFIESHRQNLPIEFRLLGYQPRPWTALDSLLCGANLAQTLNHYQYITEILRESVTHSLPPELAKDLYPNASWRDHPPGVVQNGWEFPEAEPADNEQEQLPPAPPAKKGRAAPRSKQRGALDAGALAAFEPVAPGSNNWVVSGAHTATGKPMLSNDMHLVNTVPNTWYEMHLTVGGPASSPASSESPAPYDVAGVTLPGLPYVIVGHNQRIAWGFTNLGPTVEDVHVEKVNDRGEYQVGDKWQAMSRRHEVIHVRKSPDVELDVLSTMHGPVITPIVPGEQRTLTLHWVLYEVPLSVPFYEVNKARNWDEFRAGISLLGTPSQNAVYADVDGHIGYQATGKIPIRTAGDGSVPVTDNNAQDWSGYVPFDELPRVFDPPSGVIATANGRIAPDGYPHDLSFEWGPPYRTVRIYQLLGAQKKFTPADMLNIETDVYSAFDKYCGDHFVYSVDHAPNATQRARAAANVMRGWDGRVTVDSKAAAIVALVRAELWRTLLEPRLGPAPPTSTNGQTAAVLNPVASRGWNRYTWFMSSVAMETLLSERPDRWLPQGYQDWDTLIASVVDKAVTDDARDREWGVRHRIELRHPVLGQLPLIGRFFGTGSHPLAGDGTTVKQIAGLLGPSERFTVDFGDLDHSTLNIVSGQSGQPLSDHWMDQWKAWYEGTTFTLPFTEAAVKSAAKHTLTLEP